MGKYSSIIGMSSSLGLVQARARGQPPLAVKIQSWARRRPSKSQRPAAASSQDPELGTPSRRQDPEPSRRQRARFRAGHAVAPVVVFRQNCSCCHIFAWICLDLLSIFAVRNISLHCLDLLSIFAVRNISLNCLDLLSIFTIRGKC